jgi:hypothetical protein
MGGRRTSPDAEAAPSLADAVSDAALGNRKRKAKAPTPPRADPSDVLAVLARHGMQLTFDLDERAYVSLDDTVFSRHPIRSADTEGMIRRLYRTERSWRTEDGELREVPISRQIMNTVIDTLDARARGEAPTRHPKRVAEADGASWIDLAQPGWGAIRISRRGWVVRDGRDVPFTRPRGMQKLPRPVRDRHALARLRRLLPNLAEADFFAVLFFLMAGLTPRAPYPVAVLFGPEGSQKTTTARILRAILDPHALDMVALPEQRRDFVTQGAQGHLAIYDNVSVLPDEISDQLCLRCEGTASGYRTNYSDADVTIVRSFGPTVLTSITSLVARPDLASRSLFLPCAVHAGYRDKGAVERDIAAAVPGVLALLLDAVVVALRRLKAGEAAGPVRSRLASFERLARAAAPALGLADAEVDAVFARQEQLRREAVCGNNPVALALLDLLGREAQRGDLHRTDDRAAWTGSATDLLNALNTQNPAGRFHKEWPKDPARLGGELRRLEQTLRRLGITVTEHRARDASEAAASHGRWRWLVISMPRAVATDVDAGAMVVDQDSNQRVH